MAEVELSKSAWAALGRVVSGVFIVTARQGDRQTGMLASWVQQCSFDPPQVTVALNQSRAIGEWLSVDAPFVINIIPADEPKLLKHFGKGFALDEDAFVGLDLKDTDGAPILLDALGYLNCRVVQRITTGDHDLIIGRVEDGELFRDITPRSHIRNSGAHY